MTKHIVFRILAGLVLLAAIAGIGFFAYQAGVAHGSPVDLTTLTSDSLPYHHFYGMVPFHGMGCFFPLAALFLVCLAFASLRRLIWGPRWGWRHMHGPMGRGPGDEGQMGRHGPWGEGVPGMFAEWHRRAHAGEASSDEAGKKETSK